MADGDHHPGEDDEDVASPGEVRHAIETLGVGDIKKLERVAHFWWAHCTLRSTCGLPVGWRGSAASITKPRQRAYSFMVREKIGS